MSSKNRKSSDTAPASEGYETPAWVTRLLVPMVGLPTRGTLSCDPCAGTGEVAFALGGRWDLFDINAGALEVAARNARGFPDTTIAECAVRDVTVPVAPSAKRYDVVVTNPPFSLAREVVRFGLAHAHQTFVLQRLNWLPHIPRGLPKPEVFVIPTRVAFHYFRFDKERGGWVKNRQADSIEYAWYRFGGAHGGGTWERLPETPVEVRRADFHAYWERHG